jgi:hypothetical protein
MILDVLPWSGGKSEIATNERGPSGAGSTVEPTATEGREACAPWISATA